MNWYKCLRNSVSTIFREQQRLRDGWWWPLSVPDALLANQEESDPGGIFLCTTHVMHFSFIFLFVGKDRPFASFTTNVWFSWVLTREYKHLKGYSVPHPSCFFNTCQAEQGEYVNWQIGSSSWFEMEKSLTSAQESHQCDECESWRRELVARSQQHLVAPSSSQQHTLWPSRRTTHVLLVHHCSYLIFVFFIRCQKVRNNCMPAWRKDGCGSFITNVSSATFLF